MDDKERSPIPFASAARAAEGVLFRELEGEAVILSLTAEAYFGLDAVGTRMWHVLNQSPSIEAAFEVLRDEYEVEEQQLRRDLEEFLGELVARKLIEIRDPEPR